MLYSYDVTTRVLRATSDYVQLIPLPRSNAVMDILEDYLNYKITHDAKQEDAGSSSATEEGWRSKVLQVRNLFNEMLGRRLLYRFEKQQYAMVCEQHREKYGQVDPSLIYGAEHLMRLLGTLEIAFEQIGILYGSRWLICLHCFALTLCAISVST
jgi:hypothetical protein